MADLFIKIGVNAPSSDVNDVMKILEYIYEQEITDKQIVLQGYTIDFSVGAIGVISSMTITLKYNDENNEEKEITEHVICSLNRFVNDEGNLICEITISKTAHKLVWLVFEQRKYESSEEERQQFIQEQAKVFGIV